MSNSDKDTDDGDVEVYHRVNKLKLKAGAGLHDGDGFIDIHSIKRAQTVIERKESLYGNEVEDVLKRLRSAWDKMKSDDEAVVVDGIEELYHYANHVKDLATTFNYELMGYFGASLREFSEKIDVKNEKHLIIVQAHIDVMWVVYKEHIKDGGGEKATELKKIIAAAIKKYF